MLSRLIRRYSGADLATHSGRAIIEENYWSLRRQAPIVYLLALVNLSAMEIAASGTLAPGINLPTFIAACGLIRTWQWYGSGRGTTPTHHIMMKRLRQAVWFAAAVCIAVCARCLY